MKQKMSENRRKGFTLMELLVAVAIIGVLAAIAIPAVGKYRQNLHQRELNEKAEIIYTSVQNELSRLKLVGKDNLYAPYEGSEADGYSEMSKAPSDDDGYYDYNKDGAFDSDILYYFTSTTHDKGGIADLLVNDTILDGELVSGHWVVEFDPTSALVYAVFYTDSTDETDIADFYETHFDEANERHRTGSSGVGYYGGGGDLKANVNTRVKLTAYILNEETLTLYARAVRPANVSEDVVLKVTLSDTEGNEYSEYFSVSPDSTYRDGNESYKNTTIYPDGRAYEITLTLDDLSSAATRFNALYGSESLTAKSGLHSEQVLLAGTELTIDVEASVPANSLVGSKGWEGKTNSLFGDPEEDDAEGEVHILTGRHLQNLDSSSGVDESVKSAVVENDIELAETDFEDVGFFAEYKDGYFNGIDTETGAPLFKPIENEDLTSLSGLIKDSSDPLDAGVAAVISGLTEASNGGNLGLFASVELTNTRNTFSVESLSLTGETLSGSYYGGSVGGLIGSVSGSGTLSVNGVQVYLLESDVTAKKEDMGTGSDQTATSRFLFSGMNVGGLVGSITDSTVKIQESSASSLLGVGDSASVGGLVGIVNSGDLTITASYSDSYLKAAQFAGGLVGHSGGVVKLINSYASGFIDGNYMTAGLVCGNVSSAQNVYTIVQMDSLSTSLKLKYSTAVNIFTATNVYYDTAGENDLKNTAVLKDITEEKLATLLGSAFTLNTGSSTPYNLRNQGLSVYPYPLIKSGSGLLHHYGDWKAGFEDGALVYYEKYSKDGVISYGFYGANVTSTLKDDPSYVVVGDGYGVVYTLDEAQNPPENKVTTVKAEKLHFTYDGDGNVLSTTATQTAAFKLNYTEYTEVKSDSQKTDKVYYPVENGEEKYAVYPIHELTECSEEEDFAIDDENFYYRVSIVDGTSTVTNSDVSRYYYYHPDFAKTVVMLQGDDDAAMPEINKNTYLYIRTPRQFYGMGRHYDYFQKATTLASGYVTFKQEREVDYAQYEWANFTSYSAAPADQIPIGNTEATAFTGIFDGCCNQIKNVSFASSPNTKQHYVGLFGYNKGIIRNVVLNAEYEKGNAYYIRNRSTVTTNTEVCMGVLAGYNEGTIQNCVCAGYIMKGEEDTICSVQFSKLYLGCMVGYNTGTILNSQVSSPELTVSNNLGEVWMGGFVGYNTGTGIISNCYDLAYLDVALGKGGFVKASGFYGDNRGIIENSYCATAVTISGDTESYGFGPVGGSVRSCFYLDGGTYSYVGDMRSYYADTAKTSATPVSYSELSDLCGAGTTISDKDHSLSHANTETESGIYPYPAYVRDAYRNLVHYGDWQDDVALGNIGVFYWEHEEGSGANAGYHFSFIGVEASVENDTELESATLSQGTSLCTAHDDGGVITEYGYGFYVLDESEEALTAFEWGGISSSLNTLADLQNSSAYNKAASDDLAEQMKEMTGAGSRNFKFYAITTKSPNVLYRDGDGYLEQNDGTKLNWFMRGLAPIVDFFTGRNITEEQILENINSVKKEAQALSDYLYMDNTDINGTLTLTYMGKTFKFNISPFFADSFSFDSAAVTVDTGKISKTEKNLGSDVAYGVRSYEQLQYINWHSVLQVSDFNFREADVGSGIEEQEETDSWFYLSGYNQYPYLESSKSLSWVQSHDLEPADADLDFSQRRTFVPVGQYGLPFTHSYDGGDYKVTNLYITSPVQAVGMFGRVKGATITNVSLYAEDGKGLIECKYNSNYGAMVGSLIGMAKDGTQYIANCASAGYTVQYNGNKNDAGYSENNYISVGGLVGAAFNSTIQNCSACNDLAADGSISYVRVHMGGLVGSTGDAVVKNCYTGGTMGVSGNSTHILYGGIVGNLRSNTPEATIKITYLIFFTKELNINWPWYLNGDSGSSVANCYTFCDVPASVGYYRADNLGNIASKIGTFIDNVFDSPALFVNGYSSSFVKTIVLDTFYDDNARFFIAGNACNSSGSGCTIQNCYYLNRYGTDYDNLSSSGAYYNKYNNSITSVSYEDLNCLDEEGSIDVLAALQNADSSAGWDPVTTERNGVVINGRYTFPANSNLLGLDYPFPTVVKQGTANVHYGDWTTKGPYWQDSMSTVDILTESTPGSTELVTKTYILYDEDDTLAQTLTADDFTYSPVEESERSARVKSVAGPYTSDDGKKYYEVTVEALRSGITLIYPKDSAGDAMETSRLALDVTVNLNVSLKLDSDEEYVAALSVDLRAERSGEYPTETIDLSVRSNEYMSNTGDGGYTSKDYTPYVKWNFTSDDIKDGDNPYASLEVNHGNTSALLTGYGLSTDYRVEAVYTYNGEEYVGYAHLDVTTDMPSTIGLSNRVNVNKGTGVDYSYDYVLMRLTDTENQTGVGTGLEGSIPSLLNETLDPEPDGFLFYLYGDVRFPEISVESISVSGKYDGKDTNFVVYADSAVYNDGGEHAVVVHIAENIMAPTGHKYQYKPVYVYALNSADKDKISDLKLTMVLKQNTVEETEALTYTLSCLLPPVNKTVDGRTVSFRSYDTDKTVPERYQPGGAMADETTADTLSYTLPECAFTSEYYDFAGWELATWHDAVDASDGVDAVEAGWTTEKTIYNPGDTITISSNVRLTATWTAKQFYVTLKTDGIYSDDYQLPVTGHGLYEKVHFSVNLINLGERADGYTHYKWENVDTGDRVNKTARIVDEQADCNPVYQIIWAGKLILDESGDPDGAESKTYTVVYGDVLDLSSAYEKPVEQSEKRTFLGWLYDGSTVLDINGKLTNNKPSELMDASGHWIAESPEVTFEAAYHLNNPLTLHTDGAVPDGLFTLVEGSDSVYIAYIDESNSVTVSTTLALSKVGYRFDGWYTDAEFTNKVTDAKISMSESHELWAKFVRQYTVTFDALEGQFADGKSTKSFTYERYQTVEFITEKPTWSGHTFYNWSKSTPLIVDGDDTTITITARYKKNSTITFDAGTDGTVDGQGTQTWSVEYAYNADVTIPSGATKEHYDFAGWYTAGGEELGSSLKANTETDVTYYAHYTRKPIITLSVNGGTIAKPGSFVKNDSGNYTLEVSKGTAVTLPESAQRTGYTFISWSHSSPVTVNSDVTVTANYKKNSTITFDAGADGKVDGQNTQTWSVEYSYNAEVTIPSGATKEHYDFEGWYTAASGGTKLTGTLTANTETDVTYYAHYTKKPVVTLVMGGGTLTAPGSFVKNDSGNYTLEVSKGTVVTLPETVQREHYTFMGWSESSPITVNSNVTVTANYKKNSTITFDAGADGKVDGQNTQTWSVEYSYNADVTIPSGATKEHYDFEGWYTAASGGTKLTGTLTANTETDVTYYAHYTKKPVVTLVMGGGTLTAPGSFAYDSASGNYTLEVSKGTVVTLPDVTTVSLTEKDCISWKNSSGSTVTVNTDVSFTAEYADYYKVTLDANGGSVSQTVYTISRYNTVGLTLPTPVKAYHRFNGWKQGSTVVSSSGYLPGGDVTLTADYTGYVYFNANGGTLTGYAGAEAADRVGTYQDVLTGGTVTLPSSSALSRSYYTFGGWYSDAGLTTAVSNGQSLSAGTVLYAKWNAVTSKVVFRDRGSNILTANVPQDSLGSNLSAVGVSYTQPTYSGWTLLGWFQLSEIWSGQPTIAADGTVCKQISSDITVYALWTRQAYVRATSLTDGGQYLITSGTSNTVNAACGTTGYTSVKIENVTAYTYGATSSSSISTIAADGISGYWTATTASSGKFYLYSGNGYLTDSNKNFKQLTGYPITVGEIDGNNSIWSYSGSRLSCANGHHLYFSGNAKEIRAYYSTISHNVYLYKLETLYYYK